MVRRIFLGAIGCAVLGVFACSEDPEAEVVDTEPVTEQPILTAPEAAEPTPSTGTEGTTIADSSTVTDEHPDQPDPPDTHTGPDVNTPPDSVASDPEPMDATPIEPILDSVVEFYGELEGFKVTAELNQEVTDGDGNPLPIPAAPPLIRNLTLQRPNQFSAVAEDGGAPVVVSDGKDVSAYLEATEMFLGDTAPASFSGLTETDIGLTVAFAGPFQLVPFILMGDDAQAKLIEDVSEAEHVGVDELDETPAHHLRFTSVQTTSRGAREFTWDMWVASEGDPLVLQTSMVQDQRTMSIPGEGPTTLTFSIVEKLHSWELNPELTDETFVAAVPDTAREARDILDLFEPTLLGRAAPEVSLPLFGGEDELDLASHLGTNVVILDFWATWCVPCRDAMPIIAEVAQEYQDGVVVYAVNIDETDEQIQDFLESEGLGLTVAKDAGGAVATEFGVSSIPHSVVIGKEGIVQAIHVGFAPDLGRQFRSELDALLDGQDIFDSLPDEASPEAGEPPETGDAAESNETETDGADGADEDE